MGSPCNWVSALGGQNISSDVNKDLNLKAKARTKDQTLKAKDRTKDLSFKANFQGQGPRTVVHEKAITLQ